MAIPPITMDWLLARCRQEGECLVWLPNTCCNGGRDPRSSIGGVRFVVRRAVWAMKTGEALGPGMYPSQSCDTQRCVCPKHIIARHRSELLAGFKRDAATRLRMALARRARSPISDEVVAAIRLDTRTEREIAAEHGISAATVGTYRRMERRVDISTPWSGL